MEQRIQKIIASSGFCSRRAAEKLIEEGRVSLNGQTASIGALADDARDKIEIDNNPLPDNGQRTYIMLNKPRGFLSSMSDDRGRKTVAELTNDVGARVYPVGRLDYDSEGLLIMTDDGALAHRLMHPSHEIKKTYEVRTQGEDIEKALPVLRLPLIIDDYVIHPAEVKLLNQTEDGALISITISEGRNRQIRKMCEQAGLKVLRLKRVAEGGLKLGKLPVGQWRLLEFSEIENLQKNTENTLGIAKTDKNLQEY
ncbi:MAG: pseudouridine synthase [Firmicutes bacterium HGW-Firmicutes-16]|nr:MAG: pseudouridine synthase [Firmicutes bacterium HGW-Firmicutes-16]